MSINVLTSEAFFVTARIIIDSQHVANDFITYKTKHGLLTEIKDYLDAKSMSQ